MKVLHFVHGWYPESAGGTESYLRDLLRVQRATGIAATLVTGSMAPWPDVGVEELTLEGERVLRVHRDDHWFDWHAKSWHPGVERLVEELLARERPDLVHVHHWIRLTSNLVEIADRLAIPAVVTLHDLYVSCPRCFRVRRDDEACFRPLSVASCHDCVPRMGHEDPREIDEGIELFAAQYRSEVALARAVLAATASTADLIAEKAAIPRERIEVLPLAYERRFGSPRAPGAGRQSPGEPLRLGYWGNLTRRKGLVVLLSAFRRVCEGGGGGRPIELHLLGRVDTKELEKELRELAAGLPVVFHGRYSYEVLAGLGLHLAAFPTVCFETFGFVLDECFELGLPCIVSGIGALPERAGRAALVVTPNDVESLAAALGDIAARPERLDELRAAIPSLAPTPEEHAGELLRVYERARGTPRPEGVATVPTTRRAQFLVRQRESLERRVEPPGGPR